MSFFTPKHPANPKPGSYYPKHVGFLGGAAPAVSGLQPVQFKDEGDDLVIEYAGNAEVARISAGLFRAFRDWLIEQSGVEKADNVIPSWRVSWLEELGQEKDEPEDSSFSAGEEPAETNDTNPNNQGDDSMNDKTSDELKAREDALAAKETAIREKEAAFTVDGWIKDGKLPPALKGQAVQLLSFTDGATTDALEYSTGKSASPSELLHAIIGGLPKLVDFSETDAGDVTDHGTVARGGGYQITAGADVSQDSAELDARAEEFMSQNPGVDYITAINAVQK